MFYIFWPAIACQMFFCSPDLEGSCMVYSTVLEDWTHCLLWPPSWSRFDKGLMFELLTFFSSNYLGQGQFDPGLYNIHLVVFNSHYIYIHIYIHIYTYICIYIYNLFRVQDVICINAKPTWFIPTKSQWWDFIPIHLYVVPQVLDSLSSCHSTVFFPFIESHWACLFRRNHFHYWFIGHIQIHGDEIPTLKLAAKYHQLHLPYLFLWADVPPLEPFKIGYIPRYPQYIPRKWSVNPHHVFAIGSKNERVVVHILHIAVLVLVSSQLFAVRWGEVRWGGLFTLMFTRSRGGCCVANIFSWGVAWGGMGCYLQFALPRTHTRHATLLYVFLHFHTDDMLRSCMFACISTQTSC